MSSAHKPNFQSYLPIFTRFEYSLWGNRVCRTSEFNCIPLAAFTNGSHCQTRKLPSDSLRLYEQWMAVRWEGYSKFLNLPQRRADVNGRLWRYFGISLIKQFGHIWRQLEGYYSVQHNNLKKPMKYTKSIRLLPN